MLEAYMASAEEVDQHDDCTLDQSQIASYVRATQESGFTTTAYRTDGEVMVPTPTFVGPDGTPLPPS